MPLYVVGTRELLEVHRLTNVFQKPNSNQIHAILLQILRNIFSLTRCDKEFLKCKTDFLTVGDRNNKNSSINSNNYKHKDSKNDWRGSCKIKMNNLEFSRLLTNLNIVSEI